MSNLRISGMVSNMDTDQMVKDLMRAERVKVDTVKQSRQWVQWQQDAFREVTRKAQDFQSKFFDVLNPSNNMKSASFFSKFTYDVKSGGVDNTALSVTASADATSLNVTVDAIKQLATKDTLVGDSTKIRGVYSQSITDYAAFKGSVASGLSVSLSVNGSVKTIALSGAEVGATNNLTDLKTKLNEKIGAEFGADYANLVAVDGDKIVFDMPGQNIKLLTAGSDTASMTALGITSGTGSLDYQSKSVSDLFGWATDKTLRINGKSVVISPTSTIKDMVEKINKSDLGVKISFNDLDQKFKIESSKEGSINKLDFSDAATATALNDLFKVNVTNETLPNRSLAKNAIVSINGVEMVQSSNTFALNGINYTLKATHNVTGTDPAINVTANKDKTAIVKQIKSFIEEYNKLIDHVNVKFTEKRYRSFKPLTDEEKQSLKENEVENWEAKAKSGTLRGNSDLDTFVTKLRSAIVDSVEGVGLSMSDIGIGTSGYLDKGKLTLDETKLNEKLENNFEDVVKLFTKSSDVAYTDTTQKSTRYKENGMGHRLDDILKDYVRTGREIGNKKGIFLEKAGIEKDTSVVVNALSQDILRYDERIANIERLLASRENDYYLKFSRMEQAMAQLQKQSSSVVNMLGGGQ